jgi:DNA (cytosine-5)-methyltransferase 1
MRIGSLFSGYGGLDLGVMAALDGSIAWHAEIDPDASRVLAERWPDVPNLGDITNVGWSQVEPVDVVIGGFPCQDVSSAGRRVGLRPGTRSGLWSQMAYAVSVLRPRLVIAENVRGLLSAPAASHVEPCPWCLGDDTNHGLRALGAVLGDLADLGYDTAWCGVRASDVGAPHIRFRVFVAAAHTHRQQPANERGITSGRQRTVTGADDNHFASDTSGERHRNTRSTFFGEVAQAAFPGDQRDAATDADRVGPVRAGLPRRGRGGPAHDDSPAAHTANGDEAYERPMGTTSGQRRRRVRGKPGTGTRTGTRHPAARVPDLDRSARGVDFGGYEPAIRRWEHILGRLAPPPTTDGRRGSRVLNPAFVEWMQGLPEGWVTAVPGLSRNAMLRILGNGVIAQQAAAAVPWLLDALELPLEGVP